MIRAIKTALDAAFDDISMELQKDGIRILMPTYAPQHGRLLSEFARVGGCAHISGGRKGQRLFSNVSQSSPGFDTTAYINMFPTGMCEQIVGAIPDDMLRDQKVVLFTFIPPPRPWSSYIKDRNLNTQIIATNEQDTRFFFENKGNLSHILEQAGLSDYIIPSVIVEPGISDRRLRDVYNNMKNEHGKVVVQGCVESYEPTVFVDNENDFVAMLKASRTSRKVATFINGTEANLSFLACNTAVPVSGRGVVKVNLPAGIDHDDPESLAKIEAHAAQNGVDESNVFSVTARATFKAVGDILLANERGDSVGNNIGHVYDDRVSRQIAEIGGKLGKKMALCGKVGLAGADLIVDACGRVWINEINDRQQGPTDQMSADAETCGIPGLSRLAWFVHYADFSKEKNGNLLAAIRDNADVIHHATATSQASFYIKMFATHAAEYNGQIAAKKDVPPGFYAVTKKDGVWQWGKKINVMKQPPIDLSADSVIVKIQGGGIKRGDQMTSGAEILRITGVANDNSPPFVIENGMSRLNPKWEPIIERLYRDCFGDDYIGKNPLRRPDAPTAKSGSNSNSKLKPL